MRITNEILKIKADPFEPFYVEIEWRGTKIGLLPSIYEGGDEGKYGILVVMPEDQDRHVNYVCRVKCEDQLDYPNY